MTTTHTNHAGIGTESGKHRGNSLENDPNGVDRQQELLGYLCESETLAQHLLSASPNSPLMEHAVQLCQGYLKTLLDMHHVWQRLQYARTQESSLGNQLERMQEVLQEVCGQIRADAATDERKALQARYWDNIGRLIDEVLHLSQAEVVGSKKNPPHLPLSGEEQEIATPLSTSPDQGRPGGVSSPRGASPEEQEPALKLSVHLFGEFKASLHNREIKRWPRGKGQKIFKYLLLHRTAPVRKERLMETFWPDIEARAARNNLNVSIYYLRQDLSRYHKTFAFVSYRDDCYSLNPALSLWVDTEAFDQYVKVAQQHDTHHDPGQAIASYRLAEALYQGDCLLDDDEEWASLIRQAYRMKYLSVLEYLGDRMLEAGEHQECATLWQKAVMLDSCNEKAHRRIMRCYLKMGQRQMAQRQYQVCEAALKKELNLEPSAKTIQLLNQIRQAGE
jgi:DNA-binding SARP family transcriptional activator